MEIWYPLFGVADGHEIFIAVIIIDGITWVIPPGGGGFALNLLMVAYIVSSH